MKEAASFSLKPGLKRCLQGAKEMHPHLISFPSFVGSSTHKQTLLDSLEQLNGLSSEAGEASVQHECYQGDHRIHVGPDCTTSLYCYENAYFQTYEPEKPQRRINDSNPLVTETEKEQDDAVLYLYRFLETTPVG